jgi:hypothetical protein
VGVESLGVVYFVFAAAMIPAYPLTWPNVFPRSKQRIDGQFKTSLAGALNNVERSIAAFSKDSGTKIESLVISSNVTLGQQRPADPGVAVWFTWDGLQVCIPVDRYAKVEANLQAIHHVIEARRTELRHGGLSIVRATFTGFKALPAPANDWRKVLHLPADGIDLDDARAQYRRLASAKHPDKPGGSTEAMAELNAAWEQAQEALK